MTGMLKKTGLATVLVALVAAGCGGGDPATIDAAALEDEIVQELGGQGVDAEVECPEDREAKEGDAFTCDGTTDGGLEFQVDVTQDDDEGNVSFEVAALIFNRTGIEEAITTGLDAQIEEEFLTDCSGEMDEQFIAEDGDTFICGLGGIESGTGAAVEVTIDEDDNKGFTFEIVQGSGTEAEPADDGADQEASGGGEQILVDSFEDDSNAWGSFEQPGFEAAVNTDDAQLVWSLEPGTSAVPFEQFSDVVAARSDELDDIEAGVSVSFTEGGVAGMTCMSEAGGGYALVVRATRASIHRMDQVEGGATEFTELARTDMAIDIGDVDLRIACTAQPDGSTALALAVDGETVVEAEDPDGFGSGVSGVFGAFDADVPEEERELVAIVWDDFELVAF